MFKDWAEVQACHFQTKRCRITSMANWEWDIPAQNHMDCLQASWVSNTQMIVMKDDKAVGALALLWEKELHYEACTPEAKRALDYYNSQHCDADDVKEFIHPAQKARHFENVKAPELTLHAELNHVVKQQNFAYTSGYNIDARPYLDWYYSLDEGEEREKRHLEIFTAGNFWEWDKEPCMMTIDMNDSGSNKHSSPVRKFFTWCHVDYLNRDNWCRKDDYNWWMMQPRIISIHYDQRFEQDWKKVYGEYGPNLLHPSGDPEKHIYFRQDYDSGNGYRVMNFESHKSVHDIFKLGFSWNEFGKEWDKVMDITRGTAYPGVICTYTEETGERAEIASRFVDAGEDDHTTVVEAWEGQEEYNLGISNYQDSQKEFKEPGSQNKPHIPFVKHNI